MGRLAVGLTGFSGAEVDYVLSETARCPRCLGEVTEKTLVEPRKPLFFDANPLLLYHSSSYFRSGSTRIPSNEQ